MYVRGTVPHAADDSSAAGKAGDAAQPARRAALRRWVALPLLVFYSLLLGLAALVPEVRPKWLDAPHEFATDALDIAGIRAGHALMESNYPTDYRFQAYCMIVRGEAASGAAQFLFPDDGVCPRQGFRPRLPPMERALYRFLRAAWWQQILSERGDPLGIHRGRARQTLARIGRHYCARDELRGREDARVSLVWYAYEVSYESGDLRRGNFLHFGWSCDDEELTRESWFPSDRELLVFWGAPPWD
jgi:hypothetical protein